MSDPIVFIEADGRPWQEFNRLVADLVAEGEARILRAMFGQDIGNGETRGGSRAVAEAHGIVRTQLRERGR